MVIGGNWNDRNKITSTSYRQNDKELARIYANINSLNARNFDLAPTGFSAEYSQRMQEASDRIISIYGSKEGSTQTNALERYAIDAAIAYGLDMDIEDAARNHDRFIGMFTGENLEDKSFVEAFGDMWQTYSLQKQIADLQNDFDDSDDEEEKRQLDLEMQELEREIIKHQDYSNRSWLGKNAIQAAPIANQMVRSLAWTVGGTLVGAGIAGLASGVMSGINVAGNISKGVGLLKAALTSKNAITAGARIGAIAGDAANALINVYGVEKGSFSRQLYNLVDANGERLSDGMRDMYSRMYALISTAIEFFTPEPGLSTLLRNPVTKTIVGNSVKDTIMRVGMNALGGAISESYEEMLQQVIQTASQDLAQYFANQRGENNFEIGPLSDTLANSISSGVEAFSQTLVPSFLLGGVTGGTVSLLQVGSRELVRKYDPAVVPTPEQQREAENLQERDSSATAINIRAIKMKRGKPEHDYTAPVENSDGTTSGPRKAPVINLRNNPQTGYLEPLTEADADVAKFLRNKGVKTVFAHIQQDDMVLDTEDISNSAIQHHGFYDSDTNAIYVSNNEDKAAVRNEMGSAVISSESIDDMTDRITYRNIDGKETTIDVITDPTLSDVLLNESVDITEDKAINEASITAESQERLAEVRSEIESWSARGNDWFSGNEFTKSVAGLIRKAPEQARVVLRTGLESYIRSINPSMDDSQITAMADANAVLMINLARTQGRDVADFVEGISSLGITDNPSLRGQYRENAEGRQIVLNPETMAPTTFSHEVGHYFLQTLPDGPVKDRIIDTYRKQYEADGNKIGTAMNEAFSKGLVEYQVSGQAANPEIRSIFQRLVDAMKSFINRIARTGGLSAEQKALYDSFFEQNENNEIALEESGWMSEGYHQRKTEYIATIRDWLKEENRERFKGQPMSKIAEELGRERKPVAEIPTIALKYFGVSDPKVYSGPAYFIDHAFNNHNDLSVEDYVAMLETFENATPESDILIDNSKDSKALIFTDKKNSRMFVAVAELDKATNKIVLYMTYHRRSQEIKPGYESIKQEPSVFATHPIGQNQDDSAAVGISDLHGSSNQNLTSADGPVNLNDVVLNETVDEDTLSSEQRSLRDRIRRGRAAQAQRRRRFFESIDKMLDNNLYVESDDLVTYQSNIESELKAKHTDASAPVNFSSDPRWQRIQEEKKMREHMLLYPPEYYDIARGNKSVGEFIKHVRENSGHPDSFTAEEATTAEKYYNYVNTPRPALQIQAFVDQYSSLRSLLGLKTILGPRRVASRSRSGNVFTRLYVPTSNVWQEIKNLNVNSSEDEVKAVLTSIRNNPAEWYQAYLNALISGAKTGRTNMEDTGIDLEAIAMSYYAGKKETETTSFLEKLNNSKASPSDQDTKKAQQAISSDTEEGRRARSIRRDESFSDEYLSKVVPKTMKEIELEKDRARAREAIGRSERAIRRMSNVDTANTDARFVPVAQWLYMFMHGGRPGILAELAGSDSNAYQDILEGRADPSGQTYELYPNIETDADGEITIVETYSGEMSTVDGFEANLGGARFNQQEIPEDLLRYLPEDTAEHIRTAESWNRLTAEDITNIAEATRMAKRYAQDIQQEKNRERLASAKSRSLPVASRLLKTNMKFTNSQLQGIGMDELHLGRTATPEEAMDYYRKNPARLIELYDDTHYETPGERRSKNLKDLLRDGYLGFTKIQRFTRMLDGEENGPIFNAFVRDLFESYQDMLRETHRRVNEANELFAPIMGYPDKPGLTRKQRKAERVKRDKFIAMMSEIHTLAASSAYEGERTTRQLSGYDLMQMYLNSKNINGFKKLIDPNHGSGISLEALMQYAPEQVAEFVDLELRVRKAIVDERNRINTRWNEAQIKRMEQDDSYTPDFRDTDMNWEDIPSEFKGKSFIPGRTEQLESLLEKARNTKSILNKDIRTLADTMLELLNKETQRLVEADYRQRNELMVIERNYWPLVNGEKGISSSLSIFEDPRGKKNIPYQGMLKTRDDQAMYNVLGVNPFAIFYSAIDAQERFINMGESLRNLDNMWSAHGGNIGEIVGRKFGDKMADYLYGYLRRMAGHEEYNTTLGLKVLGTLLPRLQAAFIGLSPLTVARQYVSLINTAARGESSQGQILSTTYKYLTDSIYREKVRETINALAPEIANTDITQEIGWQRRMERLQFKNDTEAARVRDSFTSWIRWHDKATKEIAWIAVYEAAKAKGSSESDAIFKASNAVQETMSVSDPISRSGLQESGNVFTRYFFMFTTDLFNTWNILFGDMINDWKEGDKIRALKRLGGIVGVSAALALINGRWLPDDSDDDDDRLFGFFDLKGFLGDFGSEMLTGIPILGNLLSDEMSGFGSSVPVVSDLFRDAKNATGEDKTFGQRLDAIIDAAITAGGAFFGAPSSSAKRAVNVFYTPEGGFAFNPLAFLNANYGDFGAMLFH